MTTTTTLIVGRPSTIANERPLPIVYCHHPLFNAVGGSLSKNAALNNNNVLYQRCNFSFPVRFVTSLVSLCFLFSHPLFPISCLVLIFFTIFSLAIIFLCHTHFPNKVKRECRRALVCSVSNKEKRFPHSNDFFGSNLK